MPRTQAKKQAPKEEREVHVEWFPVYGIRVKEWPWIKYITGQDEADAIGNLAAAMAHEGRRQDAKFRATFLNEPFEVD